MSVAECINKLVATGSVSRAVADEALGLRSKGEFRGSMGPADADAAAALATARAMEAGAKQMKYEAAKQALAFADLERHVLEHPQGPTAGIMSALTRDIWEKGGKAGLNVDTQTQTLMMRFSKHFEDAMRAYAPGLLGLSKEQMAGARNLVHEIFGSHTGDNTAKAAARGWEAATDEGVALAKSTGRNFAANEDWRLPQPWNSDRVRRFSPDEWRADFKEEIDKGGIRALWDKDTGKPVAADRHDFILDRAYNDILAGGGTTGAFSRDMRTFEFADGQAGADAWLRLQGKYGVGENIVGMLTGHLSRMAREVSLSQVIAPNHEAALSAVMRYAREEEGRLTTLQRFNPVRALESVRRIEQTYDVLTGRANAVDGPVLAGVLGALRSINTAAQLKGAIISSVPGDSVTAAFASNAVGMPATRLIEGVARELARGGEESKALATRMMLTAHSAMEYSHGFRFFQDQIAGPESFKWVANVAMRAQGLQAWTDLIKRVFSMEFSGHLADHAGYDLSRLSDANPALANFFERHQITAAEWEKIRASAPLDVQGAKFLDVSAIGDRALEDKLLGAIVDERRFAMLEPDARVRAITTGGLPQGTFMGEFARSFFLFKSFSMTMLSTHLMRLATQGPLESRIWNWTVFATFSALAGAAAMQAKNVIYGKDPESMETLSFWGKAILQGGGLGIYGDLLNSAFTRSGRSPIADFGGPVVGVAEDLTRLSSAQLRKLYEGDDTTFGAEAVRTFRRYTPGVFYTRLAADRLMFDQVQILADPDYRQSFRRMEQRLKTDTGQQFWWRPGRTEIERGPDLGAAIPSLR